MKYINRTIEKVIEEATKTSSVIMLTGSRQVGKTTIIRHMIEEKGGVFVTLDDLDDRTLAIEDPVLFFRKYNVGTDKFKPLIIDEFQYAPNLLHYIKKYVDEEKYKSLNDDSVKWQGMFYLTGSQNFKLMKNVSESLAGRVSIIELMGLSDVEIAGRVESRPFLPTLANLNEVKNVEKKSTISIYERILKGSYPELYRVENVDIAKYYKDYVRTYLERDIRDIIKTSNELKFMKFLINVAVRTGNELNLSDICNDIDVSSTTGEAWLSLLVSSNIVYLLQPYYNNKLKRITKRPKVYFLDTGLACYLAGFTDASILEKSAYKGQIFETYVISEIIKSHVNAGYSKDNRFYYIRENQSNEIDLIIEDNNILYPIEIKSNAKYDKKYASHFSILTKTGKEVGAGAVISLIDKIMPIDEKNNFVPVEGII